MNTRVSKASAAALLAIVLSLNIAPAAYAASRDGGEFGNVGDRIVRFLRDFKQFLVHTSDLIGTPKG